MIISRRRSSAFTLVEVLATLAFLGILMPVLVSALLVANRASVVSERTTVAAHLGENQLNTLLLDDAWATSSQRGGFGEEWPGYRWELAQRDWEAGAAVELTMHVFFSVQGHERDVQLSTLVNQPETTL